jgi:hypothetical protein
LEKLLSEFRVVVGRLEVVVELTPDRRPKAGVYLW